jgi:predicted transposase/invertase (TIGR01784 family)
MWPYTNDDPMKFLDIRTDFAFTKVFGSESSKPRLISFLNAILDFTENNKITDLEIVDPYNIPQLQGMKDTYVDVKAILDDKTKVIIEMQILTHPGFEKRVLYNTAKNYSMQLVKGERYSLLKPVIALSIVNFDMFPENNDIINYFKVLNKKDFSNYSDDIELVFVELNKFNKSLEECKNIQDNWMFFLKNAGELDFIPTDLPKSVKTAYEVSNEAGMSIKELDLQHKKQEFINIQVGSLQLAQEQGLKKGMKEGIVKGMEQGLEQGMEQGLEQGQLLGEKRARLKTAKKMKDNGFTTEQIKTILALNQQEINKL